MWYGMVYYKEWDIWMIEQEKGFAMNHSLSNHAYISQQHKERRKPYRPIFKTDRYICISYSPVARALA